MTYRARMAGIARAGTIAAALVGTVLAFPNPAAAQPGAQITLGSPQVSPGQLRFYLSAAGFDGPASSWMGNVSVTVDGTKLPATVEPTKDVARSDLPTRAVVLAIDTSSAMAGPALAAAQTAVNGLVDALPSDTAVGLVAYSDTARTVVPPTYERGPVHTAVTALTAAGTGNAVLSGVRQSMDAIGTGYQQRQLIVLSAGAFVPAAAGPSAGPSGSPASAAPSGSAAQTPEQTLDQLRSTSTVMDLVEYAKTASTPALAQVATGSGGKALTAAAPGLTGTLAGLASRFAAPVRVTVTVPDQFSGRATNAVVAVSAGTAAASATVPVRFAAGGAGGAGGTPSAAASSTSAGTTQLKAVAVRRLPAAVLFTGLGLVGLALAVAGFAAMNLALGRSALRRRLLEIGRFTGASGRQPDQGQNEAESSSSVMRTALAVSDRFVQRKGRGAIEQSLDRAALALRPAEWMLLRAGVTLVTAGVMLLLLPWYFGVPLGILAGWLGTAKYLTMRADRRARKFGDLLPEALNLVVGALRSGFSLLQSIDAVVREGPEPVAGEFGRAMAEIRLGGDIENALERTAERNASEDLSWLVMAIRIQREVGGNLSEVLETAVETMRERGRLARHVRALSAEGRLSAYVLTGMPVVLTAFLFVFRGEYLRPMYTELLGILMLCGAGILLVAGAFVISRMVKVEV